MWQDIKHWAARYEPAVARTLVAALLQILVVAGIGLGNLPEIVDAVLTFVALAATMLAGRSIRKSVSSPATVEAEKVKSFFRGRTEGYIDGRRDGHASAARRDSR